MDREGILPHADDPMVITLHIFNWNVKRILVDPGSSTDILYYDAYTRLGLNAEQLQPFKGTLAGFTGEQVHVRGHITLNTPFDSGANTKTIWVRYLVVNSPASYNVILECPSFNLLGAFLSRKYLIMKYPLENEGVETIKGDQKIARECYHNSFRLQTYLKRPIIKVAHSVQMIDLDPREEYQFERLEPFEDLKELPIGPHPH
jgi:hypothetical protein